MKKQIKKNMRKENRGITLIALVVTIIVLLILATISIGMLSGNNGILKKSREANQKSEKKQIEEKIKLAYLAALSNEKSTYTRENLEQELNKELNDEYEIDDSNSTTWRVTVGDVSLNIPAGKVIDTVWQNTLKTNFNYDMYVLDEEKKTITLRSGPGVSGEKIEIKKYAIIDGVKYETKFPDKCSSIFYGNNLKTVSIDANVDTSNIKDATGMFACQYIKIINAPNLITSNTTNMRGMFDGCKNLTDLKITGWDTSSVTDMSYLFQNCYSLKSIDLSEWDTSKVTKMKSIFSMNDSDTYESQLTTIYASSKFVTNKVTDDDLYVLFLNTKKLVGGNGSTYYHTASDGVYDLWGIEGARIDTTENPGLFTSR